MVKGYLSKKVIFEQPESAGACCVPEMRGTLVEACSQAREQNLQRQRSINTFGNFKEHQVVEGS